MSTNINRMNSELKKVFPEFKLLAPFGKKVELIEIHNPDRLKWVLNNRKEFAKTMRPRILHRIGFNPFEMAEEYRDKSSEAGLFVNKYEYFSKQDIGRMQSIYPVSLQNLVAEIRDYITQGIYSSPDVVNSQPTILVYICKKVGIAHKYLKFYNKNRELILQEIMDLNDIPREKAKYVILEIMNGGYSAYRDTKKTKWLRDYYKEAQVILRQIAGRFPSFYKEALKYKVELNLLYNVEGTCLSTILCTIENYILMVMCDFYKKKGLLKDTGILLYDGLMIPKSKRLSQLKSELEDYIKEKLKIKVKIKLK